MISSHSAVRSKHRSLIKVMGHVNCDGLEGDAALFLLASDYVIGHALELVGDVSVVHESVNLVDGHGVCGSHFLSLSYKVGWLVLLTLLVYILFLEYATSVESFYKNASPESSGEAFL